MRDADGKLTRENAFYLSANRNKKSITVNIADPRGQEIVRKLAARADVLVENYKVGDLTRYGLDYQSVKATNPRIIYCSVTGYGQSGPYARKPGYDAVFQGQGGLMSVTGLPEGKPGGGPMKVGPSIVDVITGLNVSNAILAALYHRDADGGDGQFIDVALLEATAKAQNIAIQEGDFILLRTGWNKWWTNLTNEQKQVLDPRVAYLMTSMMEEVLRSGTAAVMNCSSDS